MMVVMSVMVAALHLIETLSADTVRCQIQGIYIPGLPHLIVVDEVAFR
jgi:hypothetical protein